MSKMSNLNLSIQQIAKDDEKLHRAITNQLQEYINGKRPMHNLSYEARCALETYETGNEDIIEERELELFKMPSWSELSALARIMLPIVLIFLLSSPVMAKGWHNRHAGHTHYHKSSIHAPKSWNIGNPVPQHYIPIETGE